MPKWANKKQNNFNICNAVFKKKTPKSVLYDLQFLRYKGKHTEIDNFRSFFVILPS